jgi:hypothetical protein
MSETTILVVLGIKLAIVVFGRAGDWRNLVVDFSLTESIPTSGRRPIEGQAPHPRRGPADRGREARGGSEGADPHQPIREADIYLLAVDESALAVPTNSLGPMSEIAQFSNQKWALTDRLASASRRSGQQRGRAMGRHAYPPHCERDADRARRFLQAQRGMGILLHAAR